MHIAKYTFTVGTVYTHCTSARANFLSQKKSAFVLALLSVCPSLRVFPCVCLSVLEIPISFLLKCSLYQGTSGPESRKQIMGNKIKNTTIMNQ